MENTASLIASTAAEVIIEHQLHAADIGAAGEWDSTNDVDLESMQVAFGHSQLEWSKENVAKVTNIASAILHGTAHQNSEVNSIIGAKYELREGGFFVAELRKIDAPIHEICNFSRKEFKVDSGYWLFVGDLPVAIDALEVDLQQPVSALIDRLKDHPLDQKIAGYFITKRTPSHFVIGSFYEMVDGDIIRTCGWHGEDRRVDYQRDDGQGPRSASVDEWTTWKPRHDLADFPEARDPRLPYIFDLMYDIKHVSELKAALKGENRDELMALMAANEIAID